MTTPVESPEEVTAALEELAATAHLLIALDFDGTLASLNDKPMESRMLPEARRALEALVAAPHTSVALVSGRTLHDLKIISEHDDSSLVHLAGSHGAEFWHPGEGETPRESSDEDAADRALRDDVRVSAEQAVADIDGAWIEPKEFGIGLHTRLAASADAEIAASRIDSLLAERAPSWRRRTGHNILEYAYRHEGKDTAIAALRKRLGASAVLFAGDDVTDEDALASLESEDLGVRVGSGETHARVRVADAAALSHALLALAKLRSA
ncbi:trehalose 6-phosphate phosphatase [Microbacterium endophyticum]|uniref:Trehalose 6-phosphate phosphatase n=1 Tax=Microbacterium endophyticum TaxID=1526412 RepID=A0A7W4V0Q9_9MICO|nr:trehalose-phosphatase [Microbacterium endophyticum]MBB2974697.1 trehalose 6-phosphate phosphatase [Microbacterium endophyticum]NIK36994.1 trehalose 6-phosphate phosphatase [Microbacterium endophyticum]